MTDPNTYRRELAAAIDARDAARQASKAGPPPVRPKARTAASGAPRQRSGDASRWATLNAFNDLIAPHLLPTEQVVWCCMFRNCREGIASLSTRDIASQRNVSKNTVTAAIANLTAVGLIWPVYKSTHKGKASLYGVHPNPDRCLQRCVDANEERKNRHQDG